MTFELLPNEILIECFEYLNAFDIFHSFDQLNNRFNNLIRQIPLSINFEENVNKSIFDEFCTKMLLNPEIKDQVYSLHTPLSVWKSPASLRTGTFFSFFLHEEFSNLQRFKSSMPVDFILRSGWTSEMRIADTWFPKLQTLSISYIESFDRSWDRIISSITNLTLYRCRDLRDFYYLLEYAPMLKYLLINVISCDKYSFYGASNNEPYSLHLKQLIIDECWNSFNAFEMFVKQTPNLKSLTISTFDNNDMADADKWEQLITSSLHYLDIFKFNFCCRSNKDNNSIIVDKFKQFQTDFWQKQHHWFTEYAIIKNFAFIYTIPYVSNEHILLPNTKRYYNNLRNNVNTFINLTNLELYQKNLTKDCEYYFPNVISLTLISSDDDCLTRKDIDYLKKIVNLFNLKHLDISNYNATSSSVLLNILQQAPQLFSLSIKWSQLTSFFNDSELCKYLNKMIKRLYIDEERLYLDKRSYLDNKRFDRFIKNNDYRFEAKQFCQIFSNIEHLKCDSSHGKELLLLINHLSKLSTLHVKWLTEDKLTKYLFRFKEEVRKLNAIYKIEINPTCTCCEYEISDVLEAKWGSYYVNIFMWFGNNMS